MNPCADWLFHNCMCGFHFDQTYTIILMFATATTLMSDWVRSKPWVALSGMTSAALGIGSSMGLVSLLGFKYGSIVGTMPLLIMGKEEQNFL